MVITFYVVLVMVKVCMKMLEISSIATRARIANVLNQLILNPHVYRHNDYDKNYWLNTEFDADTDLYFSFIKC